MDVFKLAFETTIVGYGLLWLGAAFISFSRLLANVTYSKVIACRLNAGCGRADTGHIVWDPRF